jgi:GTP-binding protein
MIVVANKIDMVDEDGPEYTRFREYVESKGYKVFPMSAPIHIGVQEVLAEAAAQLDYLEENPIEEEYIEMFDFEKEDADPDYREVYVRRENEDYVIEGKQLRKIFNSTNFNDSGSMRYLYKYIEKSGAIEKCLEMGLEEGDIIRIFDYEFEYWDEF